MKKMLLAAVVLGGCIYKGPHVPTDLQGDVPIRIANRSSDPICAVAIMPFAGAARTDNWLGDGFRQKKIPPGGEREFKIKPGEYRVGAAACGGKWGAGTQNGKVDIQSATYVAVAGQGEAPPSYQLVTLPAMAVSQPSGGGGESGGEAAPPDRSSGDSSTESSGESGGESSGASDSSSSSGESSSQPAAAPANDCKPVGSVVDSSNECCTRATKLSADHTKNLCCDPSDDSACS